MNVVDLTAMAAAALAAIERDVPEAAHLVHERRCTLATHRVAEQGPGAYFNQIMDAVFSAAGPCPCSRCRHLPPVSTGAHLVEET